MFDTLTVYLVAIVVLLYAYVWSRGPQDGRLSRTIRRLRKGTRYWRKRALRDEAILSRMIDKKTLALVAFLCLFLIPVVNPWAYSPLAQRVNEPFMVQETPFLTASDGDESSESITVFSETLDDDVLFYPDAFLNDTVVLANAGNGSLNDGGTNYTASHSIDADYFYAGDTSAPADVDMLLNFTIPSGLAVEAADINLYVLANITGVENPYVMAYAYDGSVWDHLGNFGVDLGWYNLTFYDADGINSNLEIALIINNAAGIGEIFLDYAEVQYYVMHLADSDHYAESFADVSDWTTSDTSISSDDDLGTITENGAGSTGRAYASFSSTDYFEYYYEFRIDSMTATTANLEFWDGAAYNTLKTFTAAGTYKGIISDTDATTMQRIGFLVGSNGGNIKPDYLRVGKSTEMGWQHDGSTTAGTSNDAEADTTYTRSSDGDVLTFNYTYSGSSVLYSEFYIYGDTTTTQINAEADYYPLVELRYKASKSDTVGSAHSTFRSYYDGVYIVQESLNYDGEWHTLRWNHKAGGASGSATYLYFLFFCYMNQATDTVQLEIDWLKIYSIANWTYTGSGVGTDDYLYVDSGVLHSHIDDGYIELDYDPALSVSGTCSVYNLTTSGTAPQFSQYVSEWSTYSDDTRGATTSGTVTDIKLKFDSTETLSAIKFIEDGTAPSVLRISATPPEPDDTESVTLSALATDTVEVYKVWFRPITGPTGYSQTDYESTEQADNLWTYEFSSLDEGYWAFKAIAFDGANNSTLDADSVTDFWVREKELIISNTLYTETSTQCSFAGQTNVACDYLIYDDDVEQESGNKAAGSFFLDWTKQTSVGTHDWGIKFYTASSTDWHNGSYEVLTTTLLVTEYGIRTTDNYAYLNGYVTLDSNYKVYEETVEVGTGSVSAGSFEIRWTKASSSVENVTVLFESGSQSYNVYSGYDVAAQTTFVVESWWMDLNLGVESYVEFYVLSSFENATVYVYDNNTLMTTATESAGGAYSYFWLSESEGLHIITLNITHGATVHTRTRTYYVPDWAATGLVVRWNLWTFQDNYTMLSLESNWRNCSYSVYLNGSLVATSANDPVTLNFTRSINVGEYNLTIFADGDTQTYSIKNIRYIITEEGVSYDYSSVTGGRSVAYGDNYYDYYTITGEPTPGILIDQGTATIVSVGGFLIIFTAYLFAREAKKGEILKTERVFNR